ncbi:SH3 domain-containing protein [Teichococcus oryzae]|uniref:SH3 domain-containing protein n=1 Tax=Teichococcus oryzae TaxID=1608942 RepID=A0A5B2TDE5_9PROT|nr:SH3 domain-containing protein [Pseudoroseomonas oryzae]KAA2212512.1 SH3 domain-containing protein [Pseudoroseomonas oryzae]
MKATIVAALALLATACDEKEGGADETALKAAHSAAEAELRRSGGPQTTLRGVQLYRQAQGGIAVCGQASLPNSGGAFTLFVSLVTPREGETPLVEQHVATSGSTASRVFVETVSRCYEDGGPPAQQRAGAPPPMPPVPDRLPEVARPEVPAPQPRAALPLATPPSDPTPALITEPPRFQGRVVTMRQNGNLRAHPGGGGQVVRVVPGGTALKVFGDAPGGWLEVGAEAPEGWMHGSMTR